MREGRIRRAAAQPAVPSRRRHHEVVGPLLPSAAGGRRCGGASKSAACAAKSFLARRPWLPQWRHEPRCAVRVCIGFWLCDGGRRAASHQPTSSLRLNSRVDAQDASRFRWRATRLGRGAWRPEEPDAVTAPAVVRRHIPLRGRRKCIARAPSVLTEFQCGLTSVPTNGSRWGPLPHRPTLWARSRGLVLPFSRSRKSERDFPSTLAAAFIGNRRARRKAARKSERENVPLRKAVLNVAEEADPPRYDRSVSARYDPIWYELPGCRPTLAGSVP